MALPLTIRKNIRDTQEALQANLELINTATGKQFEFEADFAATVSKLSADHQKNSIGETYHKEAMRCLAENLQGLCKDEMSKEAFDEATSASKIIIRVNDKIPTYWAYKFENGALVLEHKSALCNLYEIRNADLVAIMPTPGLPLATRMVIEQNKPRLDEALEEIATLTGESDWSLEVDWEKVITVLPEHRKKDIGEVYYKEVMSSLVSNLKRTLKDETTKEAFNEATNQHKITIELNDKQKTYWDIEFANGGIKITHKKEIANLYEVNNINIVDKIPSPGGLPLATRLNIESNKEKLDEFLEQIAQVTGESDWSVEADFEKIVKLNPNRTKDIGEVYYKEVLHNFITNVKRTLTSETTKEAFNEATSQHKIVIDVDDKIKTYWDLKFEDGAIKITHKKDLANLYEITNLNLEERIPSPGLPLPTRLNIERHKEHLEENLEKIRTITGESDWAFEADFEKFVRLCPQQAKEAGEMYYKQVLGSLADNLKRNLANETTKEAFNEATNQHKVVVRVSENPKETSYWRMSFENGELVLTHKKECANLYEINNLNTAALIPVPGILTLVARLNIQENQEKLNEHLETIREATGEPDYSFDDSCLEACYKAMKNNQNFVGDTFLKEAMGCLAENLQKALKDDMVKEAFNETATAHQITFRPNPDPKANTYWTLKFENGVVVLIFKPEVANLYEIRNFNIEALL